MYTTVLLVGSVAIVGSPSSAAQPEGVASFPLYDHASPFALVAHPTTLTPRWCVTVELSLAIEKSGGPRSLKTVTICGPDGAVASVIAVSARSELLAGVT